MVLFSLLLLMNIYCGFSQKTIRISQDTICHIMHKDDKMILDNSFGGSEQMEIRLYSEVPNAKLHYVDEVRRIDKDGTLAYIEKVTDPFLIIFSPVKKNGTSVILCPGGGYERLNIRNARYVASKLNDWGVTVFVLAYRLPSSETMCDPTIGPLQDLQASLKFVYQNAETYRLDKNKIGVWGSSAGGHLAAMASTHFDVSFLSDDNYEGLRPAFTILTWPVISLRFQKGGTSKNLLGENIEEKVVAFFSPNEHVTKHTPPTFLVHASNDPSVSAENSILYYRALQKNEVPVELHIYQNSNHGFGISPEVIDHVWMEELKKWLTLNHLI